MFFTNAASFPSSFSHGSLYKKGPDRLTEEYINSNIDSENDKGDEKEELNQKRKNNSPLSEKFDMTADEIYRCGWIYISPSYEWPVGIDLAVLQKMKNEAPYKRPRDVFFVVLKNRALCLYENEEQQMCLLYIILNGQVLIEIYPYHIASDEHYYKEHPLRLFSKKRPLLGQSVFELYMWMPNASEKEDWFYSIRRAGGTSTCLLHETQKLYKPYMESLHNRLSSINHNDLWYNIIIGRVFFNIFKSDDIKKQIVTKIQRKLELAKLPTLLSSIVLKKLDLGDSLPVIENARYHGHYQNNQDLIVSLDMSYQGLFSIELETDIRLNVLYTSSLNPFIIPITLAINIKELSGRLMVLIKPPPSNRIWYGFYKLPKLAISVEPIVSSRVITWSIIHQLIMSKIQESLMQSIVLPNMDDIAIPSLKINDLIGGEVPFSSVSPFLFPSPIQSPSPYHSHSHSHSLNRETESESEMKLERGKGRYSHQYNENRSNTSNTEDIDIIMASISDINKLETRSEPNITTKENYNYRNKNEKDEDVLSFKSYCK